MSIKDLFNKKVVVIESAASASVKTESSDFISSSLQEMETFIPPIDFRTASNFVKYGSAELYYENAIKRIYQQYPYDGTLSEQKMYHLSSSALDRWVFKYKYPKSTGYINLGQNYGSSLGSKGDYEGYGNLEWIRINGGIHTASAGMTGKPLYKTFDDSNIYDTNTNRTHCLKTNMSDGVTIEFWLRKPASKSVGKNEVLFDLWNGNNSGSSDHGRVTLEYDTSGGTKQRFLLTLHSGSTNGTTGIGFTRQAIGPSIGAAIDNWTHYAVTMKNDSSNIRVRFYVNGKESSNQTLGTSRMGEFRGKINAHIGSLITNPVGDVYHDANPALNQGWGRLSGSMDEFRFWKTKRTSEEIETNYWHPFGGGQNKKHPDELKNNLGVYYKFNEGITAVATTDSKVLDYSGRISNGVWNNYPSSQTPRSTGSAFEISKVLEKEPADPIIYSSHPSVSTLLSEMKISGSLHDREKGIYLYDTLPSWIRDEDEQFQSNTKKLMQTVASHFDTLYSQISYINKIKDKRYFEIDNPHFEDRPHHFAKRILESQGFSVAEIFPNSSMYQYFMDRDVDTTKYSMSLEEVKNVIYQNIYNNLEQIYKSKGTESSIRNFIRCFGIDDELLKINLYTDKAKHYLRDRVKHTSFKKKYVNFNSPKHFSASLYQTGSSANNLTYLLGHGSSTNHERVTAFTYEADIIVPYKIKKYQDGYFNTPFVSASIFGQHRAKSTSTDYTWESTDSNEFQVYLVRQELDSPHAYFVLKSTTLGVELKTGLYKDIYDNERWNLAVRLKPETFPYGEGHLSSTATKYTIDFYGVNYNMDVVQNEFHLSASISNALGLDFARTNKRIYAGAHLTNFTGSVVKHTDLKIGGIRFWADYLENNTIKQHALDASNVGANTGSYSNSTIFTPTLTAKHIPKYDTAGLVWDFDTVTGSNSAGSFVAEDVSSGSTGTLYGWIDNLINKENRAKSKNFPASSKLMISPEFVYSSKKELPEISFSNDNIVIKGDEEKFFIEDDDVSDNFLSIEKSMYQIVSEEMLNTFSSVREFSNLIGKAQDRYTRRYERLDHLRKIFFKKVQASPDFDKFTEYYRWIDSSISMMIHQLIPVSLRASQEISNMYESHILERNKYQNKFPLTQRYESTEAHLRGVEELRYNWKFGHANKQFSKATINIQIPVVAGQKITFGDGVKTPIAYTFVPTSPGSNEILIDSNLQTQRNLIKSRLEADFDVEVTTTQVMSVINNNTASPYGITSTLALPNKVSGFGKAFLENRNCLWWKDRAQRTRAFPGASSEYNKDKEELRNVIVSEVSSSNINQAKSDKTIYQGSTYAIRKFSNPLRMRVTEQSTIHSGINYDKRKNRNIVHNAVGVHGGFNPAPVNVLIAGIDAGSGLNEEKNCSDIITPVYDSKNASIVSKKKKRHGLIEHGRHYKEEYLGFYSLDTVLPFNIYTNPASSGVDKSLVADYTASVTFTNLHSDTYGNTNDIGVQGPFTNAWVGGHQHRHIQLNKSSSVGTSTNGLDSPDNRPEAWRVFTQVASFDPNDPNVGGTDPDIIFGIVGPDYGGPYPDTARKYATRYREETTKRPLNIKNIQTIRPMFKSNGAYVTSSTGQIMTGSVLQGNYFSNYEVVQAHSRTNNNLYIKKALSSKDVDKQESILIPEAMANKRSLVYQEKTLLEETTNYSSLYGRRASLLHNDGNIFLRKPKYTGAGASTTGGYGVEWSADDVGFRIQKLMATWIKESGTSRIREWTFAGWSYMLNIPERTYAVVAKFGNNSLEGCQINFCRPKGAGNQKFHIDIIQAGTAADKMGHYRTISNFSSDMWHHIVVHFAPVSIKDVPIVYVDGVKQEVQQILFADSLVFAKSDPSWFYLGKSTLPNLLAYVPIDTPAQSAFKGKITDFNLWHHPRESGLPIPREFDKFAKRHFNRGFLIDPNNLSDDTQVLWFTMGRSPYDDVFNGIYNNMINIKNSQAGYAQLDQFDSTTPTNISSPMLYENSPKIVDTSGYHWEWSFDKDRPPTGSYTDSVIVSRFSSPGGPEQMSQGFLDVRGNEMSVYNALPFRNTSVLGNKTRFNPVGNIAIGGSGELDDGIRVTYLPNVRLGLNALTAMHSRKQGLLTAGPQSKDLNKLASSLIQPSFHKIQRNTQYKIIPTTSPTNPKFNKKYDNGFVTSPIPRSDFQYSWITSSLGSNYSIHSGQQVIYDYAPRSGKVDSHAKGTKAFGSINLKSVFYMNSGVTRQGFEIDSVITQPLRITLSDGDNILEFEFDKDGIYTGFPVFPINLGSNTVWEQYANGFVKAILASPLNLSAVATGATVTITSDVPGKLNSLPQFVQIIKDNIVNDIEYTPFVNVRAAFVEAIIFPSASEIVGV